MAFFSSKLPLALFLSSLFLHAAIAELVCENLPSNVCAFAIASSGKRCLLETAVGGKGIVEYQCRTSEVVVEGKSEYIETDQCVKACGVDRKAVGISSDALLEPQVTAKLCSPDCYQKCPNIIDLYSNLAAGEGVSLPDLCEGQRTNPHRAMSELLSSGVAPGPVVTDHHYSAESTQAPSSAPAPAPL
ncbi:hypothetical protein I3760_09G203500 [Carya illinoinensis]|uniref:PAR1 protein n=1 Tax=Carya illinoinensis TaxID=32201 RepID=A0A922E661_CARIL|nr:hypothetical protein I3760_09G203500 [Carya illinoinensis]KAG6697531.1 hypothetical protein I3842_09G206300 [Carya illinoinensis]